MNSLSTTSTLDDTAARGIVMRDRRDMERAFRRATRHSRVVRLLRFVLPVAIVVSVGATLASVWLDPKRLLARLPGDPGKLVISGTKITMQAPKFSGFTRDQRPYDVTAQSATQDVTNPNIVELHGIRAKVETADKNAVYVLAEDGLFDRKANVMTLSRDVTVTMGNGTEISLEEVVIDTVGGTMVSKRPVKVVADQAVIRANRLEVSNSGDVIRFSDNVVVNITPVSNRSSSTSGEK